ncbi:MAG: ClbS/DfsB family four-helix bundle protein [Anaerolineae bacterium]|nr:ClbS/DfsB family four-helix bundle protein [Anaerolineae bacterium]
MNKSELLAQLRAGRQRLETVLARADTDHLLLPTLPGSWSVKHLLAHLGWWEQWVAAMYHTLSRGETPAYPPKLDEVTLNQINARIFAESQNHSLAEAREQEAEAYQALVELVERAPAEDLFNPRRFAWTEGHFLAEEILDNSAGHYAEHWRDLLAGLWQAAARQPFSGWDFSYLADKWLEEKPPWSYGVMARELMAQAQAVLDLGTGGGEKLLGFKDVFPPRVVATEGYPLNFRLARERLEPLGVEVVESDDSLFEILPFENEAFDLVLDRHTGFNIAEVERVLAPGGVFLTQQVDGRNLNDLSAAFDCEQPWTYFTLDFVLDTIKETDLVVEMAQEWTGKLIFKDIGAMVYYLQAVPWIVENFSVERNFDHLLALQRRLEQEGELAFGQRLMVVRVSKSKG